MNKIKVVVVGNCQARPVAALLEGMSDRIEVTKVAIVHLLNSSQESEYVKELEDADHIVAQLVSSDYPCRFVRTEDLKAKYGGKVTTIVNLFFKGYHPDWMYLKPPGIGALKGPMGDYHNSIIFDGWKSQVETTQIKSRLLSCDYYNINFKDAVQNSLYELKQRESKADVKIAHYIESKYADEIMFFTFNHPSLLLLKEYTLRILLRLDVTPTVMPDGEASEPLDQFMINVAPNIEGYSAIRMYRGLRLDFDGVSRLVTSDRKEYDIEGLINAFYDFYDSNCNQLKDEKNGYFKINGKNIVVGLITEEFISDLTISFLSDPNWLSMDIDFSQVLKSDALSERIKARFLVLYIQKFKKEAAYVALIEVVLNNITLLKYPFVSAVVCDTVFNNVVIFKVVNSVKIEELIVTLSGQPVSLNKLKVLSVDNKEQFEILKSEIKGFCDKSSRDSNVILFNSYFCYGDFKEYYLDTFPGIEFKIGENDENYLSILFRLFKMFDEKFEFMLLEGIVGCNNIVVADLIISQHADKDKYVEFVENSRFISVENKLLLKRLCNLDSANGLVTTYKKENAIKVKPRIAVCLSGQLRGYKTTFENINDILSKHFDFDIFISTWSNVGCRMPYPLTAADRVFKNDFLIEFKNTISTGLLSWEEFQSLYPSLISLIESQNDIDEEFIYNAFRSARKVYIDIEDEKDVSIPDNQSKMYYKIERCFENIERASESIVDYDFILRARPDRKLKIDDIDFMSESTGAAPGDKLYLDMPAAIHFFKGMTVGDTLAFGRPELIKTYSKFYSNFKSNGGVIRAHNDLAYYLYSLGISTSMSGIEPVGFFNPDLSDADILLAIQKDSKGRASKVDKVFINSLSGNEGVVLN